MSSRSTIAAVVQGLGLGFAPLWQVGSLVERGEVEILLEAFEALRVPIHAMAADAHAAWQHPAVRRCAGGAAQA